MKKNIIKFFIIQTIIVCLPMLAFAESATILVDGGKDLGVVNPLIWGTNLMTDSDSGEGVWNHENHTVNTEMVKATKKAGIKFLRFPGGCLTHHYLWKNAIGPANSRSESTSIYGNEHYNKFGIAEFITFCRQVGAEPIVTVSYFAGGPEDAAQLVEYCNGSAGSIYGALREKHGYPEPFNIKYWEIGNEIFHGTSVPHKDLSLYAVTSANYAHRLKIFSNMMKKKDPSILIGAVGMEMGLNGLDFFGTFWNRNLMEISKKEIDFISIHPYLPGYHTNPASDPVGHFKALMAASEQTAYGISEMQSLWANISKVSKPPLKVALTEYHAGFLTEERFSWGGALFLADFIIMMLDPQNRVLGSNYMEHSNGFWGMFKGYGTIDMRPDAKIFNLLSQNRGNKIIPLEISSSSYEPPNIGFIHSRASLMSGVNILKGDNYALDPGFEKGNFTGSWQILKAQGASATIDSTVKRSGNNSVRVDFDGTRDINFLNVFQSVDLVPGETYRLSGYIRTKNLQDVHGVSIALMEVNDWKLFNIYTQYLSGDNEWTWVEKTFTVPAKVTKVLLMLRRFSGEGKISGKAWFDDISIQKYKSSPYQKIPVISAFATESQQEDKIILWVINRSPTISIDVTFSFTNVEFSSNKCKLKTAIGSGTGIGVLFAKQMIITDTEKSFDKKALTHTLAPASLTVLSFDKKTLPTPMPPSNVKLEQID